MVQWLGPCDSRAGAQVQSLVRGLRSHLLHRTASTLFFNGAQHVGLGTFGSQLHQTPQILPLSTTSGPGIWNKRKVSGPACAQPPDLMGPLHLASLIWNSGHAGFGRSQDPSAPKGAGAGGPSDAVADACVGSRHGGWRPLSPLLPLFLPR